MGCWNGTCGITNLPIHHGEDIVFYILRENRLRDCPGFGAGICYSDELFSPLGLPIYGKYDDYGGIEKIQNPRIAETIVRAANFNGSFEDMLSAIGDNHRDDENLAALGWTALRGYSTMMFHRFAVDLIVEHVKTEQKDTYKRYEEEIQLHLDHLKLKDELAAIGHSLVSSLQRMLNNSDSVMSVLLDFEDAAPEVLRHKIFDIGMNCIRKPWMPQAGAGSQNEGLSMYRNLAKAVIDYTHRNEDLRDY